MLLYRLISLLLGGSGVCLAGIASVEDIQGYGYPVVKDKLKTNDVASDQSDAFSVYKNLMDVKEVIGERKPKDDSEGLRMVKAAIKTVLETALHSFLNGFLPAMDRVRRSADDEKRSYLDGVVYMIGALLGKQKCSHMIACRTGKMVQTKMPGAQLAVMMAEPMIPNSMLDWFGVVKKSVIDRSDNCDIEYDCSLQEDNYIPNSLPVRPK
ncbi:uncharacterized protein LOC111708740 [Eurytemora carolleeae]|uniref:uncharacterized protein LOC111708740 n=1 Tax=Eurytemora carolleeae TaxID=1294199 RepID=UPI000C755ACF|nr:uncharacterized protein LOC111708740 [Eurytemora carolleeae]|eukprot:XP_023337969.1 uncharacterized protein LOC111708740 [Eurytemora affinis]